jgi:DNA polymerase family B
LDKFKKNTLTKKSDADSKVKNSRKNSKCGKLNKQYYSSLIDAGGCRSLALGYSRSTGILNTLVTGGRCNNEQPFQFEKDYVFDFDLSSCYGTALTQFSFPIGLPTIYARTVKETRIKLIDFLKIYESELVENLYTITVSGKLSFEQDLIYSKIVDEKKLSEKILKIISDNTEDEIDIIDEGVSKVVLLRKEILYGVITSDILNALRKICSSQEWSEIGQLEVDTAIYYSKKNFVADKGVFLEELKKNPGSYTYSIEKQGVSDERNRSWTSIELNQFIGPLLAKRKSIKKEMNQISLSPENKFQLNGQQQTLKLLINTLYGVFCSPYFSVSNTVLANCITARARLGVWMASRALNGIQCITDGFAYSPVDVFKLKTDNINFKKPGLKMFSNLELLKKNYYVESTSLGEIDWKPIFLNNSFHDCNYYQSLDQNVEEHLASFWSSYNLSIPYKVEHKLENTGTKMVYFKRAHYAILKLDGSILYKFRGLHETEKEVDNPTYFQLAKSLLKGDGYFVFNNENTVFLEHELNTINDFFMSKKKVLINGDGSVIEAKNILIPGFSRINKKIFHYNLSDMPSLTSKMYKMLENIILDEEIKEKGNSLS